MKFIKSLLPYVIILVVVILIRTFIVTPIKVNGKSMQPTLNGNEIMILNKIGMHLREIKRFNIVVIKDSEGYLIKRVIGLPGETISCKNGVIYINGKKIVDDFGEGKTGEIEATKIPNDAYYVMGDNRENSLDSRYIGSINVQEIQGTTSIILFPFKSFGKVD